MRASLVLAVGSAVALIGFSGAGFGAFSAARLATQQVNTAGGLSVTSIALTGDPVGTALTESVMDMVPGDYRERVIDLSVPYDANVMYSVKGTVVSDATPTALPGVSQAGDALNSLNGTNAGLLASDPSDVNAPAGQGGLFVEIYQCSGAGNAYESTAGAIASRTDDREVSCRNAGVPQGPKGNGTAVTQTDVAAFPQFSMISSGHEHTCGIRWDASMWCWGRNNYGQIGDGSTTIRAVPVQVGAGSSWATVSAGGRHTCARQTNNTLWCWGANYWGQVGDGSTTDRLSPTQVNADVNWTSLVASGSHTCALKTTGTLWCWGANGDGYTLGANLGSQVNVPTQIGSNTTWSSLSSGATGATTCATRTNNTLWCWGANYYGQVGIGTADPDYGVPITQVGVATTWSQVSTGGGHTCAVQLDGSLWCWGANSSGQLGLGTTVDQYSPVRVGVSNSWATVAVGANSTCARRVDSTLWCWGANGLGQVGDGTYNSPLAPVNVGVSNSWVTVSLGSDFACANSIQGSTFCWGSNVYSQLGNSESFPKRIPARIGSSTNWSTIDSSNDHTCAITTTNTLWCWGYNFFGQLGLGTTVDQYTPAQVGTDTNWLRVSAGTRHTCAIKTTGTMWCWGVGSFGRLGNGGTASSTTPVQAGTDTDWTQVTAGEEHTCATKSTGTLWCWGRNDQHELGMSQTTLNRLVPTQVATDTDWSRVATGLYHTCALKTTGTLWCWGDNSSNQLGEAGGDRSSPLQVGSATNWASIDTGGMHNCALRTTGTLWCWGYNAYGAIGNGTTTSAVTPTQVGTDTNWNNVDTGQIHTCARRNHGTLWCWGYNGDSQIGDGSTTDRLSPTQIGTDTDWLTPEGGYRHSCALRGNGELWCWGDNLYGRLGIELRNPNPSVPVALTFEVFSTPVLARPSGTSLRLLIRIRLTNDGTTDGRQNTLLGESITLTHRFTLTNRTPGAL